MTQSRPDPDFLISTVREVSRALILPRFRDLDATQISAKSDPFDLVTIADQEAEEAMRRAILARYPQTRVIGEEAVSARPNLISEIAEAESCVIIDPIDGTGNFVAGLTTFGVILAVTVAGETAFGLLYDPVMDDWIMAERGAGASYASPRGETRRLQMRPPRPLPESEGFAPMGVLTPGGPTRLMRAFDQVGYVRSLRCSCHEYRTLAFGQADFNFSDAGMPWDHAAGTLIVTEAGGASETENGDPYRPVGPVPEIWAANSAETLRRLRA